MELVATLIWSLHVWYVVVYDWSIPRESIVIIFWFH